MFRARRMMELDEMMARLEAEKAEAARVAAEEALLSAAIASADEEATTVLNIADVLDKLEVGRLDQDRTGVQVLGTDAGSRGEVVLICPADPDDEAPSWIQERRVSRLGDEEISEILYGPWTKPVEQQPLQPDELEAAILEADEEDSEIIPGPWLADEEATCMYNQAELEALLSRS